MFRMNRGTIGAVGDALLSSLSRLSQFWPLSWRSLSAIVLGVLLAKWVWILFAPHTTYISALPLQTDEVEAGRLFGVAVSGEVSKQGVALQNVTLLGIFSATGGKAGFAILKLDNSRQVGVAEGEEIAPGTKLTSVNSDHVLIERAGLQQRINLEDKYASQTTK